MSKVLKVLPIKICKIEPPDLLFIVVLSAFTSADIVFHKFLDLHSTLTEKKIFVMNFPFLTDSLTTKTKLEMHSWKHIHGNIFAETHSNF